MVNATPWLLYLLKRDLWKNLVFTGIRTPDVLRIVWNKNILYGKHAAFWVLKHVVRIVSSAFNREFLADYLCQAQICICYDQWGTQSYGQKLDASFHVCVNRDTFNVIMSAHGLLCVHWADYWQSKILEGDFLLLWGTSTLAYTIFRVDEPRVFGGWFQDGDVRIRSVWGQSGIAQQNMGDRTVLQCPNRHRELIAGREVWEFEGCIVVWHLVLCVTTAQAAAIVILTVDGVVGIDVQDQRLSNNSFPDAFCFSYLSVPNIILSHDVVLVVPLNTEFKVNCTVSFVFSCTAAVSHGKHNAQ